MLLVIPQNLLCFFFAGSFFYRSLDLYIKNCLKILLLEKKKDVCVKFV